MPTVKKSRTRKPPLKESHPHLFKQLLPEKNEGINLSKLTGGSSKRLIWTCDVCNHEWEAQVNNRSYYDTACPKCSLENRDYSGGIGGNNLRTPPLYIARYDIFKELTVPDPALRTASRDRVSWTCSTCKHQWEVPVQQRVYHNTRCPQCVRVDLVGTSKLEYRFFDVLSNHPDLANVQHGVTLDQKFESGRKMTVDFAFTHIPSGTYVYMEIDGKRWHKDEAQFKLDTYKTNKLLEETDAYIVRTRNDGLAFLDINHERLRQVNFKWSTNEGPVEAMVKDILEGI